MHDLIVRNERSVICLTRPCVGRQADRNNALRRQILQSARFDCRAFLRVRVSVRKKRTNTKGIVSLTICLRWSIILLLLFSVRHFPKGLFRPYVDVHDTAESCLPQLYYLSINCHFLKEISITTVEWDDLKANSGLRSHGCDYMNLEEFGVASASSCSKHLICLSIAIS
jgi:hypothetical protein